MTSEPLTAGCQTCAGSGLIETTEWVCCGNVLPSGECCAAVYGTDRLVPEPVQDYCGVCRGTGEAHDDR